MDKDDRIGLGLIGCGDFGRFCLAAYRRMEQVRIAAVADVVGAAAERLGREFAATPLADPQALLAHPAVELVHIATPPSTHYGLALAAIRAGKHVLCEKPLALSTAQADEIIAAAAQAGVIAPVNFVLRYNQVVRTVKALIDSAVLGRVLHAQLTNCAKDTKLTPGHWFWDKAVSGGIFLEHGVHFFDLYRHWLGPGRVVSAHAELREGTGMEDRVVCTVRHANGVLAGHYHGFDQMDLMDRAEHRLVCETGDIRVVGWVPLGLTIDTATDEAGAERLAAICPGARMEVIATFDERTGRTFGRGKRRRVSKRIHLEYTPRLDKPAVYADNIRALLADQIAYIRDRSHRREVVESDGREAVAMAEAATRLAEQGRGAATPEDRG